MAATVSPAYVTRSGLACFLISTNGSIGGPPSPVTAVNSAPTIKVNGNAITLAGPTWTSSSNYWPFILYQMQCGGVQSLLVQVGGHGYTSGTISVEWSGGGGTGLVLGTPVLVSGVVTSVPVTTPGTGATQGGAINILDSTSAGSGFVGVAPVSGGGYSTVIIESGGQNYSSNPANLSVVKADNNAQPSGYAFGNIGVSSGVLLSIPIISPGTGFTSAPTITVTDSLMGTGAVVVAIMSGPAPADVVTYSAASGWLTTVAGSVPAATNATVANYAGMIEPWFNQSAPALKIGSGFGAPNTTQNGYQKQQNWLKLTGAGAFTGAAAPAVTFTPASGDTTGVFAAGYAVVNSLGHVTGVVMTCGGYAYTLPPIVTIAAPPSGTQATATSVLTGTIVSSVVMVVNGTGYGGSTTDLHPIAINGTTTPDGSGSSLPVAYTTIERNDVSTGAAILATYPDQSGIWTYVADESNPGNPMTVSLYASVNSIFRTLITPLSSPTGGTTGKTWTWNVPRNGRNNLYITLCVTAPMGSGSSAPWTHSNEFMAAPVRGTGAAQTVNQSKPYAPNPNLISWLTSPGVLSPTYVRTSPFGDFNNGCSNVVDPSDLQPATAFNYAGTGALTVVATAIRPYQVSAVNPSGYTISPYIWSSQAWPGTSAVGGGPAAYAWTPPGNASGNNLNFLGNNSANGPYTNYCGEVVTASPHGLKTGQQVQFYGSPNVSVYDAYANATVTLSTNGFTGPCYVTGSNTFAFIASGYGTININNTRVSNVNATATANWQVGSPIPSGGNSLPYEISANLAAALPGCGLHTYIPNMATDATVTQIATTIRDIMPVGRKIVPEYCDEHWNGSYPSTGVFWPLATLASGALGIPAYGPDQMFAIRQAQIQQIFINVFNAADINGNTNRGGSIVRAFGSWGITSAGTTDNMLGMIESYNAAFPSAPYGVDAIMMSFYTDAPTDASVVAAAAGTYSSYPGSIGYQSATPWTMARYHDLWRHYERFDQNRAAVCTLTLAKCAAFTLPPGQTVAPALWAYECSPQNVIPTGVSTTDWKIRGYLTYDFSYHPYYYDTMNGFFAGMSANGVSQAQLNELCYGYGGSGGTVINGNSDGFPTSLWEYLTWEGQTWGRGDGTIDGNGNATTNAFWNGTGTVHDLTNVSPKMSAWRDWAAAWNGSGGSSGVSEQTILMLLSIMPGVYADDIATNIGVAPAGLGYTTKLVLVNILGQPYATDFITHMGVGGSSLGSGTVNRLVAVFGQQAALDLIDNL